MASAADPLLVLYGSETGNARDVAERIAREAARGGDDAGSVHCLSMDRFEVTQLPTAPLVVCVCSTTGQGDPPANMRDFWRFLLRKSLPADSLNAVRFAVFGLGDSHYQKYNVAAKRLHRRLLALGARELLDLGLGDDQHPTGYEATLDPWLERLWRALGRTVGPSTSAHHQSVESQPADPCRVVVRVVEAPEGLGSGLGSEAGTNDRVDDDRPVRDVEARVRELCDAARELDRALEAAAAIPPRLLRSSSRMASSSSSSARAFTEDRPAVATVLVNAPLTAPDADAEVRHVEIAAADVLGAGEPPHRPGDCLAVSPLPQDDDAGETRAATIEVLRRAGIAPDAWVVCELSDSCRTGVGHAYVGTPVRAMALVEGALDLASASPRRYFFETAATFASHPREAERLRHFASKDGRDELWYYNERERRCVREFLEDFPSVAMPLGWMLTTAPRLRPRLFSIASAASAAPDAIHLTVTTVRWKTHYGRTRHGLCSNAIARVAPGSGSSKLACWLCSNGATFPPPRDDAPLVLVCTGSGVAPLRSLVQDRVHRALHAGARIAPTLVFFGCRREAGDFLYREEWEALAGDPIALLGHPELRTFVNDTNDDGSCGSPLNPKPNPKPSEVVHLEGGFVPAFSRDGATKDYVQHRIASHAMRVWRMLRAGAAVYVAGSAAKMPQDVRETMEKVVEACGGVSIDDARAYVRGMENGGRYVVEAW